ncbi:MAG: aminotransferase class I/II-fold pyridoxal phosphate-dependent enzyme, partial [Planctomycetota bacterium]
MNSISPDLVLQAVESVVGQSDDLTLLHEPSIPPLAWDFVKECLDTGWVSSAGAFVTKFEEQLAKTTGANRAVAVVNGTAALQVCLELSGVRAGDEVLTPSLSFVATANAIRHAHATPHFVDACPQRLSMCPEALLQRLEQIATRKNGHWVNQETDARIAAICPMHC